MGECVSYLQDGSQLKGDDLKLVMDGLKQIPEMPKLDWGWSKPNERPKKYVEWRAYVSMAFEGVSQEVFLYWEATMDAVDKAHKLYLQAGPQDRLKIKPLSPTLRNGSWWKIE